MHHNRMWSTHTYTIHVTMLTRSTSNLYSNIWKRHTTMPNNPTSSSGQSSLQINTSSPLSPYTHLNIPLHTQLITLPLSSLKKSNQIKSISYFFFNQVYQSIQVPILNIMYLLKKNKPVLWSLWTTIFLGNPLRLSMCCILLVISAQNWRVTSSSKAFPKYCDWSLITLHYGTLFHSTYQHLKLFYYFCLHPAELQLRGTGIL